MKVWARCYLSDNTSVYTLIIGKTMSDAVNSIIESETIKQLSIYPEKILIPGEKDVSTVKN